MSNSATDRIRQDWESQANNWYERREAFLAATRPVHEWLVEHLERSSAIDHEIFRNDL